MLIMPVALQKKERKNMLTNSQKQKTVVSILMGSANDFNIMQVAIDTLKDFSIAHEVKVLSAHRTPHEVAEYIQSQEKQGCLVFIAGAGGAAHLAGVIASHTTLPVLGVPIDSSPLLGFDALLATVQMPAGVPVATLAVGKAGAKNAALLAISILSVSDMSLRQKLQQFRQEQKAKILQHEINQ